MAELIREAIDTYQPVAAAAGRVLRGQSAAVVVRGDRSLLFQVLQNLLDNAINHGGGDIDLDVRQEGQQVVLSVRDHGAGVPEALMPRLTERFFRVDEARSGTWRSCMHCMVN
jgi:signal transduction histidine kinase